MAGLAATGRRAGEELMHTVVPLQLQRDFVVAAPPAQAHALLADVPRSAAHFPDVQRLLPLGDNTFRWEMQPAGVGELSLQTVYASRYSDDPQALRTRWEPVHGVGNAEVAGYWQLSAVPQGTRVHLSLDARFTLPVPALLGQVASRLLARELGRQVDIYIANLRRTLGAPS